MTTVTVRFALDPYARLNELPESVVLASDAPRFWNDVLTSGGVMGQRLDQHRWLYLWHEPAADLIDVAVISESEGWSVNASVDRSVAVQLMDRSSSSAALDVALKSVDVEWVSGPLKQGGTTAWRPPDSA